MVQEISGCNHCVFCHRTHESGGGIGGSHGIFNTNNITTHVCFSKIIAFISIKECDIFCIQIYRYN